MVYPLYNCILFCVGLFLLPYYQLRGLRYGKSRRGARERLGYFTDEQLRQVEGKKVIWFHAVSVGETRASIPLLKRLRQEYPDYTLLVTNVTETGHALAEELDSVDICFFFPFDFTWVVRKVLKIVSPRLIIIVETELWPNFIREAQRLHFPLMMVNGRLSDRSFPRYRRIRLLLKPVLDCFHFFCMQSQTDAERIAALGAPSFKIENTGNLKFDHAFRDASEQELRQRKELYHLPQESIVLVAGSTHDGEEQIFRDSFLRIRDRIGSQLRLVIIPRHPERRKEIQSVFKDTGLRVCLRSDLSADVPLLSQDDVLLVDTFGEVLDLYSIANAVFVGGSFVTVGGHNLLEPALVGKPVLFGPHVHNFKEIARKIVRAGGGLKVMNAAELDEQLLRLLGDTNRAQAMGMAGRALIAENTGATQRTLRHIERILH